MINIKYVFKKQFEDFFLVECPECKKIIEIAGDAKSWDGNDIECKCKKCGFVSDGLDYIEIKNLRRGSIGCITVVILPIVAFFLLKGIVTLNAITTMILCGTVLIGLIIIGVFFLSLAYRDMSTVDEYLKKKNRKKRR